MKSAFKKGFQMNEKLLKKKGQMMMCEANLKKKILKGGYVCFYSRMFKI